MTRKTVGIALCALGLAAQGAVNWDDALVIGRTNGDKCFYAAGEEMVFTLELKGVKGEIPPGEYFLDWVRTANDGKTEKGRAEASLAKPLVIRTALDRPGFVKIEANLVDKTGKRVPKKHMWEKRVFFQGGAGVEIEKLQAWPEPKDFDAHWAAERKIIDDLPLKVIERVQIPCANPGLNLWRMKLNAPEGYRPATGYLVIPKAASAANRMKATGKLSGYYDFPERCPGWLTNHVDGIEMYINRHGCEVDREADYYKQFYSKWPNPPDHFRGMVFRALQMFRFLKTLPEWNGKDLIAYGTSGGGMQTFWMGALVPGLTRIDCATPALADVYGFKYGRASSGLGAHVDEINYYDICNFAKRVTCPVTIGAGLGDYTCPPAGIAIVYNNLKGRKQITWSQGCTHGWWPTGMKKVTFKADAQVADKAELARRVATGAVGAVDPVAYVREALARGEKTVTVPKGRYVIDTDDTVFFRLKGLDGVTVDFGGSELVCKKRTRYIGLEHCTNTVVRNVTLDMDPLPFSQGVIEKVGPDGAWEVRVLDDYAQPEERAGGKDAYRDVWPLQVYDRTTLETKNWMRAFNGFKMEAIGPCRFRVTGGGNRRGDVGDYCVWRTGETTRQAEAFGIHLEKCRNCRVDDVTMYACWGVAFNEHFTSGSVWKNCRLMRRPPETDARRHSVPRLRSGAHDAFNSRMAGKGPRLENCSFAYHCDDCVNISGYYAVVTEVEGRRARILYKGKTRFGKVLFAGDTLEIMTPEGMTKPEHPKLLAVREDAPQTPSELAWLKTLKLWPGQAEICTDGARVELDRPGLLAKGDLIIAENRQGNGWALVGCSFGPNRAYGIRIRASHGLVENCTFNRTEGEAALVGPEYEWFEGGFGNDILFRNNRFIGYEGRTRLYVGGGAAYGKRIPLSAHVNVKEIEE